MGVEQCDGQRERRANDPESGEHTPPGGSRHTPPRGSSFTVWLLALSFLFLQENVVCLGVGIAH